MDPVLRHLRVNHFPVCLAVVGVAAAVVAAILRKDAIWRYAQITVLVAAAAAPVAQWTGDRAEAVVGAADDIDPGIQDRMYVHEDSATIALYCMLAAGAAAAVSLWKPHPAARWAFLAVSLVGTGAVGYTSKQGGEILHSVPLHKMTIEETESSESAEK